VSAFEPPSLTSETAGARPQSSIWTPRRLELVEWFTREAPSLVDAYRGAVLLIHDASFPACLHFVGHAVRDIADRLPFVLDGELRSGRVQYENRLDRVLDSWPFADSTNANDTGAPQPSSQEITIPKSVYLALDGLIRDHRERRNRPSNTDLLFRALLRDDAAGSAAADRLVRAFKEERDWFMEHAHMRSQPMGVVPHAEQLKHFERFETLLHNVVGRFFTATRELDEILREANQAAG